MGGRSGNLGARPAPKVRRPGAHLSCVIPPKTRVVAALALASMAGCSGTIGEGDLPGVPAPGAAQPPDPVTPVVPAAPARPGASPLQDPAPSSAVPRLSRRELENTVFDLFGIRGLASKHLPLDRLDPFDTGEDDNEASAVFVEGLESLAADLGRQVAADAALLRRLSGCAPAAADDQACLRALITNVGRRMWRRPVDAATAGALLATATVFARDGQSFATAARFVVQALAQSAPFLYRLQIGVPDPKRPGVRRLDNFELAARLSYLLWGSTPDPALLDEAQGPAFTPAKLVALASARLGDARASEQMVAFHRMWIGYDGLGVPEALAAPALRESDALVRRVLVTDRRPWSEIFTLRQTFLDPALARHYGLPAPATSAPGWVDYPDPDRSGLLSHASFLSLAARDGDDTSPTIRGKYIATRLLCRTIPAPPPDADADVAPDPGPGGCKADAYAAHRQKGSPCYGCHQLMDPIGFGLERLDGFGRYRTVEKRNPACPISGDGELAGVGPFNGPRQLVRLMLDSGELAGCGVRQLLAFAFGQAPSPDDRSLIERLQEAFLASGTDFRRLVLGIVQDPVFGLRVER